MPDPKRPPGPLLFAALPAVHDPRAPEPWPGLFTRAVLDAELAGIDALVVEHGADRTDPALDPVVVLAHLAPRTYRLGLVAEMPAAPDAPQGAARELASLDAISGGRAGRLVRGPADPHAPAAPHSGPTDHGTALTWTADGTGPALDVLDVLLAETAPDESADAQADRIAAALAATRSDGLLLRFSGPAALRRFARETLPLLRDRGLLPAPPHTPRGGHRNTK
ncbi:LLM class flavin-dependent oxidoreductase [Streptomyces virginiae]|uniref:LLM class flavin-dependent oxidoreductase n=2 Tax=Streptomyces TaxID=1883 RepID=A0ABZ1T2I5_STRVG|nr:LLM class flavin-dependent oxidoreductase [Streptomyces virginiae]WTB20145.1 LLM class flavin-dependent oxidoreductase [Streptomyces virginiae]